MNLRISSCTIAAIFTASLALPGHAQNVSDYPARAVTIVVPTAPGGATDAAARLYAEALSKSLHQPFLVENRPGANGIIGAEFVARSAPDGYRLLFAYTAAMVTNPHFMKKSSFDPVKDFSPVAQVTRGGSLMVVRHDFPATTLEDFVAYVKARPGKISYCSWGDGSGGHLTMESLKKQAGIRMEHIAYKGSAPCAQDLIGGHVDAAFVDITSSVELIRANRIKALAHSGPSRLPMLPNVPSMTEAGYPFTNYTWLGLFAPAKTPSAVVNALNKAINDAQQDAQLIKKMRDLNLQDMPMLSPEQFSKVIADDLRDWGVLIRSLPIKLEP